MKKNSIVHYIFVMFALAFYEKAQAVKSDSNLPPSWEAGGRAKLKSMPRYSMESRQEETSQKKRSHRDSDLPWTVGLAIGLPELVRLDISREVNSMIDLSLFMSPGIPFEITVEMPSDVIKSDKSNTLAAAYTAFDAKFDAAWGPHLGIGVAVRPLKGAWFIQSVAGYRQIGLKGEAESQLRVCTIAEAIKEPPCGNIQQALQTRNRLRVNADAKVNSTILSASTGWNWKTGDNWSILLDLGVSKAVSNTYKVDVEANIVDVDGVPQEVSGALADMKTKAEKDVSEKAVTELETFSKALLPVLHFGIGYRF